MDTPADKTTPPASAPAAPTNATPPVEETDPTLKLLFDAAESERPKPDEKPEVFTGRSLMQALDEPAADAPPAGDANAPKADEKKPAEPPAPAPKAEDKPIKVRRPAKQEASPAPPAPPQPQAPKVDEKPKEKSEEEKFEESLLDEERDQLELARFAESKDPKYKGLATKTAKFLKDHQEYLEKNPQATEPGSDAAERYQEWLKKNSVALPPREMRILEREMITERAREKVLKETDSKLSEIHDENFRRDKEPEIKREAEDFFNKTAQAAIPQEFAALAREKGIEEAKKSFPLEFRVTAEVLTEAASDVEEFRRLTTINPRTGRPLAAYDPSSAKHARILNFIREQCDFFKNGVPGENEDQRAARLRAQIQNGKQFVTRDEYFSMPPEQRGPYWTFTPEQIVAMQSEVAKKRIADRVKQEYAMREAEGWIRRPAQSTPPEQRPAGAPPAPRPSPIPGSGAPAPELPDRTFGLLMGDPV